jgi:hypothetical protein
MMLKRVNGWQFSDSDFLPRYRQELKSDVAQPYTLIITVVVVLACSALIGWMGWWYLQWAEKPRRVRRILFFLAGVYVLGAISGIWGVATGNAPIWSLLFLPLPLASHGSTFALPLECEFRRSDLP